ncbi:MAG: hypothetical protein CVU42_06730 [Chloroflexi bacterium HGW-Chloroflexi-4]|jgi:phosphopantetheinyl transferase|nr:MAG: hypothetical protein CVU42_06730 [Chloroflexi bacterium HGW-Chloroflexi-4]
MIYWTFSSFTNSPPLKIAQTLERFFSILEIEEFEKFKIPKRQLEWLASRMLVKRLVHQLAISDSPLSLRSVTVQKEITGVPYVVMEGMGRVGWLSLSHSHEGVLTAFSQEGEARFGVDLEFIEPRSLQLFLDYFTATEIAWLSTLNEKEKDLCSNIVWSSKEAFLKAIERGLSLDTRKINIHPCDVSYLSKGWTEINFEVDGMVTGEWQLLASSHQGYVMTICLQRARELKRVVLQDLFSFDE